MTKYVWQHTIEGEADRLRLMSEILDPSSQEHISRLPLAADWKCLEIGAGNGSLSQWLATQLGPKGKVTATDLTPNLMKGIETDILEVRKLDVVKDGLEEGAYDFVALRALLHHLPERMEVIASVVRSLRPGGWLLIHEPDFYPTLTVEPEDQAAFWRDFLAWSVEKRIDFHVGRKVAPRLQDLGAEEIRAEGHTTLYEGGSKYAQWWRLGIAEVADQMLADRATTEDRLQHFFELNQDPRYWTMSIAFTATTARRPVG